jgi:hypothetical protein
VIPLIFISRRLSSLQKTHNEHHHKDTPIMRPVQATVEKPFPKTARPENRKPMYEKPQTGNFRIARFPLTDGG